MTDDEDKSRRWNDAMSKAVRSFSPPGMPAVNPAGSPSQPPTSNDPLWREVLELTRDLGVEVNNLIPEFRALKNWVRGGILVGIALTTGFVMGAYFMREAAIEQAAWRRTQELAHRETINQRSLDRKEITTALEQAEGAALRAEHAAMQAAAESVGAQVEAAETRVRILPPRERPKVERKIEQKRQKAAKLGADVEE